MTTDLPTKICATCEAEKPVTAFIGKQRSCRDCADKARRAKAAEKPGAKGKTVRKPPVEYTAELGRQVCDLIAEGETLTDIGLMPGFPAVRDIARWRAEIDEFAAAFAIAKDTRADIRVDGIAKAVKEMRKGDLDHAVGKAVVDGLKWLAGKDSPRYADKVTIDQTIRPGQPEPEAEQVTKAWIARVIASSSNVIELKPEPAKDDEAAA
jgi:ribosomal protein L40E